MSKDELYDKFRQQQEFEANRNKIHRELIARFRAGDLHLSQMHWHENAEDIDLSKQRDRLDPRLLCEGFKIISSVPVESLFANMTIQDANFFRRKSLYDSDSDRQTSAIIDYWLKGVKLIPPTFLVYNDRFGKLLELFHHRPSNEIMPVDGKHRLNVAYYFGAVSVPILVISDQYELIRNILL